MYAATAQVLLCKPQPAKTKNEKQKTKLSVKSSPAQPVQPSPVPAPARPSPAQPSSQPSLPQKSERKSKKQNPLKTWQSFRSKLSLKTPDPNPIQFLLNPKPYVGKLSDERPKATGHCLPSATARKAPLQAMASGLA